MANKKRRCAHCKKYFDQETGILRVAQFFCTKEHLIEYAVSNSKKLSEKGRQIQQKKEKACLRERKESLRPRSWYLKEAQRWFNKFIRLRDKGLPCISCGRPYRESNGGKYSLFDAGHYRSVGSCPELRFEEDNIAGQCVYCNRDMSGNAVAYRAGLINRIGVERVERIEGPHEPKKYTIDDLKELITKYKRKCKELEG